jgi:hypothetical protein
LVVVIPGLIGLAVWERRGGRVPKSPELELPVHGLQALLVGLVIVLVAFAIILIDLAVMSTTVE